MNNILRLSMGVLVVVGLQANTLTIVPVECKNNKDVSVVYNTFEHGKPQDNIKTLSTKTLTVSNFDSEPEIDLIKNFGHGVQGGDILQSLDLIPVRQLNMTMV